MAPRRYGIGLVLVLAGLLLGGPAWTQDARRVAQTREDDLARKVAALQAAKAKLKRDLVELARARDTARAEVAVKERRIAELERRVAEQEAALGASREQVERLNLLLTSTASQLRNVGAALEVSESKVKQQEGTISDLYSRLKTLGQLIEKDPRSCQEAVKELETQVADLQMKQAVASTVASGATGAGTNTTAPVGARKAGDKFRDCADCPEMVVVLVGEFLKGSSESEAQRDSDEGPQHRVMIARPLAVGKYEVTSAEWDACVADGGCGGYRPDDRWGRGRMPII